MQDARTPKPGQQAPEFELRDQAGSKQRLSGLCRAGPVVLIFFRGSHDPDSVRLLLDYRDRALSLRQVGTRVVAVSASPAAEALWLRQERGLSFPLLGDTDLKVIETWGLREQHTEEPRSQPAVFVLDRKRVVRTRFLEPTPREGGADAVLAFIKRGGAGARRRNPLIEAFTRLGGFFRNTREEVRQGISQKAEH